MANAIRIDLSVGVLDRTEPGLSNIIKKVKDFGNKIEDSGKKAKKAEEYISRFDKAVERTQRNLSQWANETYEVLLDVRECITPVLQNVEGRIRSVSGKTWKVTLKAVDLITSPLARLMELQKNFSAQVQQHLSIGSKAANVSEGAGRLEMYRSTGPTTKSKRFGMSESTIMGEGEILGKAFSEGVAENIDFDAIGGKFEEVIFNVLASVGAIQSEDGGSTILDWADKHAPLFDIASATLDIGSKLFGGKDSGGWELGGKIKTFGKSTFDKIKEPVGKVSESVIKKFNEPGGKIKTVVQNVYGGAKTGAHAIGNITKKAIGSFSLADEIAGVGMAKGSGLMGTLGKTGMALGSGATTSTGMVLAGAGSIVGGAVGAATLASGAVDLYKAGHSNNKEEKKAYQKSAAHKFGGVAGGAAVGATIGSIVPGIGTGVGALIGGGIGGVIGWINGNKEVEEYEQKEAAKAEKAMKATGVSVENLVIKNKDLKKALNDSEVSAEEFAVMYQQAVEEAGESHFGDVALSLKEIKKIAASISFGEQTESLNKFSEASQELDQVYEGFQGSIKTLDKMNWKASLGVELDDNEKEGYMSAIDDMISGAKEYIESSHYETVCGVNLLFAGEDSGDMIAGLNSLYGSLQQEVDAASSELSAKVKIALEDGVITVDEAAEIENLQNQITGITDSLGQAQGRAQMDSLKIRYDTSDMNVDSFNSMQEELKINNEQAADNYKKALDETLAANALRVERDEGYTQEDYEADMEELQNKYKERMKELEDNTLNFDLDIISENFKDELENIFPEIEGSTSEKLKMAMENAMASMPDISEWGSQEYKEDIIKCFNLEGIDGPVQEKIIQFLQSTAATMPNSVKDVIESNVKSTAPTLRSSTESLVQSVFDSAIDVAAKVNLSYNIGKGANALIQVGLDIIDQKQDEKHKANGGFINGKQLSWIGEEGPEAIIPLVPGRRGRALELYKRTGEMLGVGANAAGGMIGEGLIPALSNYNNHEIPEQHSQSNEDYYSSTNPNHTGNGQERTPVQVNVNMTPEFHITGSEEQSEEDIMQVVKRHIKEMADELGGEIASRLDQVFSNMPLKEA